MKLAGTKSDARRLIQGNGASINGRTITDVKAVISLSDADEDGDFVVRAGKKKICRIVCQ